MEAITVPGTLDSLTHIAQYVISAANAAGLDKKATYKLRLAVDEIATNIIVHGYEEAGIEGDVFCQASLDDNCLTIVIEDTGDKFDPTQHAEPEDLKLPMESRKIGGLGVYLTIQGVDKFTYERFGGRNRNIFVVNCTPVVIS
jgi:serine/threonine-protein kinase RsbW